MKEKNNTLIIKLVQKTAQHLPIPYTDASDEMLVERVQAHGEIAAFDELIIRYKKKLYSVIYHMTSNHEDTGDLLQETLIRAFKGLPGFKVNAKFSTWIYRIAVNVTINHLRRQKKRERVTFSLDDMELDAHQLEELKDVAVSELVPSQHDREMKIANLQTILNQSIQSLSEKHRIVVVMHDIQGLTHAQISEIIKVPTGTVKTRLFHAHKILQKKLGRYLKHDHN